MSKEQLAQTLFDNGDVQKENSDTFVCLGSNGKQYEITRVNDPQYNYKFYCKCPAWKFDTSRECKHVLAVKLFEKSSLVTGSGITKRLNRPTKSRSTQANQGYKVVKRSKQDLKNDIEWKEPDGKITRLKFDSEGNLIGKEKK
jgi:hypothetical protein